ncbi:MAG TPA: uroporphyrinogen decarboxylase family protein [Candidatus Hydrogenedentes bacterium]|nr:uroporphyrinogen decarboxylase family protein [Candidatus Hydrogenedentota bacterium]HPC18387.1 uroporphyrinogen decarboxylase family protein [Candidatus Hydrogenedentota bacterium]HRT22144.1 uroporphyrinogen decarboxylase family protein [Candidatus Hydrogenedentota bacterium]HRT66873.1 uroporphyrinogen decarboxylase family protein [Candidatus Hydrogenedentota bacterium]
MTSRERVLKALAFEETDRVPMDLAGMPSTGVSCFAYPGLVAALGLPYRPPRVYDTGQMLALPDLDVLDALGTDVVTLTMDYTNAFDEPDKWRPYDFGGRLPALVRDPCAFETLPDGTVIQHGGQSRMPPAAHVFESEHGGQPFDLAGELPKPDLREVEKNNRDWQFSNEQIDATARYFERVRNATDRAILFCGPGAGIGIGAYYGVATFPMLCMTEPDFVARLHEITIHYACERVQSLLKVIHPYIDVYQCSSDDWGTQNQTFAAPAVFDELFKPYYRRFTDAIHAAGPNVKTFLHSCGAIYDILDMVIESGFDVLNPVQWTAGGHSFREWKDKARNRIALWGGGVNTQVTLPLGTVEDVEREVREIVACMRRDGGYVFCAIHNILAEIPGEKIVALYRACS